MILQPLMYSTNEEDNKLYREEFEKLEEMANNGEVNH